jgi:quinolinate synthase
VVSYVNCSAEVKAMSDIICTSSNAADIINSIPESQPIIFAPDANLGRYLRQVTGRNLKLWQGACLVHEAFAFDKLMELMKREPAAQLIAHPESDSDILRMADFIGSTGKLLNYVQESKRNTFVIATEVGIIHQMQKEVPHKRLIPAPIYEDNSCACSECAFMKSNTLEKLHRCLVDDSPEIVMDSTLLNEAKKPLERMLEYSK